MNPPFLMTAAVEVKYQYGTCMSAPPEGKKGVLEGILCTQHTCMDKLKDLVAAPDVINDVHVCMCVKVGMHRMSYQVAYLCFACMRSPVECHVCMLMCLCLCVCEEHVSPQVEYLRKRAQPRGVPRTKIQSFLKRECGVQF
jgi:hypothetical protein